LMFAVLVVITFLGISSYWIFQTFERRFLQSQF
jgi:ABC-type nitrate/sulfonate/bicarbonate transport system permease component